MTRIILTGTACAGKSTLLNTLTKKGYQTFEEAETPLVEELKDKFGNEEAKQLILGNYTEFKRKVGERQKVIDATPINGKPVFYDRSAICYIGYCNLRNANVPENLIDLASKTNPGYVFFLDRLSHFNEQKEKGKFMTEMEADKLAGLIKHEYALRGIELIIVPEFSLQKDINLSRRIEHIEKYCTG